MRIISVIPLPYHLAWPLFSIIILSLSAISLMLFEKAFPYLDAFLMVSIIIALEGAIISWAHHKISSLGVILANILDLPQVKAIERCREQRAEILNDRGIFLFAALFMLFVHVAGIDYHAISFDSDISFLAFKLSYFLAVYLEGAGLYILIMTAIAVHNIGAMPIRIGALYSDFHAIGLLYSKFTICAAVVYVVWGFFHIIVPPQFSSLQMMLWFFSFAILLFAYFLLPQYNIHRMMRSTKRERIDLFSYQLSAALNGSASVPSDESLGHINDMFMVHDKLAQMSEWPFGAREILYITLIIIIPLVVVLLEIAIGIIK